MPKKKIRRRLKLQEQTSRAEFLEKVKRYPIAKGKEILVNPTDRDKMSQVLLDFIDPLLENFGSEIPVKTVLGVGIMAWNLSLFSEGERRKLLVQVVKDLSPETEDVKAMYETITWLIDRKKQYFDRHKRHILEFRLSDFGHRYGLQVFSVDVPGNQ
jgi:hypothetical protein